MTSARLPQLGHRLFFASQAVPVPQLERGLCNLPGGADRMRFCLGYVLEHWWELGQAGASSAEMNDQGIFFRSEFNS